METDVLLMQVRGCGKNLRAHPRQIVTLPENYAEIDFITMAIIAD